MFQADLFGPLQVAVYNLLPTSFVVFTKHLLAVLLTTASADAVARKNVRFFFQHSYFPHTFVTDFGTNFASQLSK